MAQPRRVEFEDMHNRVRLTSRVHPHPDYPRRFQDEEGQKLSVYVEPLQEGETLEINDIARLDGNMVRVLKIEDLDEEPGLRLTVLKVV